MAEANLGARRSLAWQVIERDAEFAEMAQLSSSHGARSDGFSRTWNPNKFLVRKPRGESVDHTAVRLTVESWMELSARDESSAILMLNEVTRHAGTLLGISGLEIDDVVQEVLLLCIRTEMAPVTRGPKDVTLLDRVTGIAANLVRNLRRSSRRRRKREEQVANASTDFFLKPSPAIQAEEDEEVGAAALRLSKAVRQFSQPKRNIAMLLIEGRSNVEIRRYLHFWTGIGERGASQQIEVAVGWLEAAILGTGEPWNAPPHTRKTAFDLLRPPDLRTWND